MTILIVNPDPELKVSCVWKFKNRLIEILQIAVPARTQAEINNRTNVDPTLDTNFRLSESDFQRTVEMITMYSVGTTPVSNVISILVTNIFLTLAVNISKILVIYFYY